MSSALTKQKLCLDFAALKHACPKGVYVAPNPDEPLSWSGVLFVRKGPYAHAILRFRIDFPDNYPESPPIVSFLSDVFHPLVTPLTTYTHTARDTGSDTVSAADRDRLPPGGLSIRHGFPEWFETVRESAESKDVLVTQAEQEGLSTTPKSEDRSSPLTVEVLQYLRVVFDTEAILDSVPLEAAANAGAWHAWRSYRAKILDGRGSPVANTPSSASDAAKDRSISPRMQPGGARRPGEWNWQGVWEDRVKKSIQASISEHMLYSGDNNDVVSFSKMDSDMLQDVMPSKVPQVT